MFCEECEKRPANVHMTKIINGNKVEKHLCEQCAKKQQDQIGFAIIPDFSFSNILSSMLNVDPFTSFGNVQDNEITCDKCGMTYSQFAKTGRMGCNKCYSFYGNKLEHLLKRIQGNTQHIGKIPKRTGENIRLKQELNNARIELQKAVLNEEFEKAAKLRDKIKELEKRKNSKGGDVGDQKND
ncbi:MAG: protein arginine kinase activator [Clostridia bacterium]|jgi:protein arginine kinase activator|nr:protein arginine kinase activator [Clostridia bacterium]MDN5324048.1 protein arginine kinase activator [Clostridia bacterium]